MTTLNRISWSRRALLGAALGAMMLAGTAPAMAQTAPLRIAISLGDIPRLWGGPDGGFEGVRFGGYMVYDSLAGWDMTKADKPSTVVPALAESWQIDPADPKRWIFKLRPGVTFHDGSPFNADAAIWNLDSIFKSDAPQYNSQRSAAIKFRLSSIASYRKVDDSTIAITTNAPNGMFIYEATVIFMVSPARFAALGNDWAKFAAQPSGTGPYKAVNLVPRERLELEAFAQYWDKARVPKSAKTILIPMPDANTRVAALRSGQVDFIETLPPDAIESMKRAGFKVVTNVYPHVWIWRLNVDPASPFADIRVRQAANLAIDRDAIAKLVNDTGAPAKGYVVPTSPWFGKPSFDIRYDPAAAKRLLAEAGFGPGKPVQAKIILASGGGGQMVPLPMNEAIQEYLKEVGIEVTYEVVDFITIINMLRAGAKAENQRGAAGINIAMPVQEPNTSFVTYDSATVAPRGANWGQYNNAEIDAALAAARAVSDPAKLDAAMAKIHETLVSQAAALFVVHDLNPRAHSAKVQGFVQAQNWFQDYTPIVVK